MARPNAAGPSWVWRRRVVIGAVDALDGTPVLGLIPYYPVCDRVERPTIPAWLSDGPEWWPEEGFGL